MAVFQPYSEKLLPFGDIDPVSHNTKGSSPFSRRTFYGLPVEHYYALIMAGGGGTRLWPMSRKDMPKQLLPLINHDTMFRASVQRLQPLFPPEQIYVVTGRKFADLMRNDVPEIPAENFILEPYGRDNFAAAGLGIAVIHQRDPQATIAILTADHHIGKEQHFRDVLAVAYEIAQNSSIVTLGIAPSFPATGFGYIRRGDVLKENNGFISYHAVEFTEKPNVVTATAFLGSGMYSWNSGMFIWKTDTAFEEFKRQQAATHRLFAQLMPYIDTPNFETQLEAIWNKVPKNTIDFAIMEGAQNMVVIPVDIGWNDVGSWASLYEVMKKDKFGNSFGGDVKRHVILNTHNTLVFSDRLTVAIGVEDLVVVDTEDALLICHRDQAQEVRDVVKYLRETGQDRYL